MKHNLLKSLIISVILLTGVSNVWGRTIYLCTSDINWASDNAVLFVWSWQDDNQGVATKMTSATTHLYKADIADNHNKIIFMRMKNGSTEISWENDLWNRTQGDQNINDETPCFKLTAWGNNSKECSGTWGKISYDAHIYLDNSVANWSETTKEFMIGYSSYSDTYTMTQISNTKLYYLAFLDIWHGYWDYGFIGVTSHWGPWKNQDITTRIKSATKRTGTRGDQVLNGTKLFVPANADNDATLNKFDYNSYNDLNHTQTIKAQVKYGETKPAYKQVISPATITAKTNYFNSENSANGNGLLTIDRGATDPAKLTQTVAAAYTSTVTLSYTDLHEAYEFMDWWDDTNQKTISTSATCTYVATKATTVYARFKAKGNYTRTVYLDARNWNTHNPRYAVYAYYGAESGQNEWIDMTPAYGTNWYYTCEVPAKYSHVIFCRMNPANNNNTFNDDDIRWGQTNDLLVLLDLDENNCFTPSGDPTEPRGKIYNGNWSTPPTFIVTLAGTDYGTYKVTCGEQEITVSDQETKTITNVPVGTQLTITNIVPKTEGYDQTMVYSLDDGANYTYFSDSTEIDGNRTYTYTVNSDVTIAEDFRTTDSRVVYIKVTYKPYWHWCTINNEEHVYPRIIYYNGVNQNRLHNEANLESFELLAETNQYNIYGVKIPKGYNSFKLYPGNSFSEYGGPEEVFSYQIIPPEGPLKNCFEFDNVDNNTGPKPAGKWVGATITAKTTGADGNNTKGIGRYGIRYNGETRYATDDQNATFDIQVPYGGNIELRALKGEPGNEAYTGYLIMNDIDTIYFSNGATDTLMNINVTRDIEFDDFFVTKEPHIVYLGVPESVKNSWQNNDNTNKSIAYAEHQYNTSRGAICLQEISTTKNGTTYYKFTIPAGWNNFRFELKKDGEHNEYNTYPIHATIRFPYGIPTDENNCFTLTGGSGHEFTGTWGEAPQCQVEMGYTNIGRYGIKDYTGEIHYATPGGTNTTFYVPYGTQVEVLEGEPGNNAYNGMVGIFNGNNLVKKFHDGQNQDNLVTITGYTMFDDLFVSKQEHIVYLGVPNEGFDNWRLNDGERMTVRRIWPRDYIQSEYVNYEEMFVIDDITYYKFTLPQGLCSFQFSHRQQSNDSQISASRHFLYQIPVTEYNCFILENRQDGNGDYDGYWAKLPAEPENEGDYRVLYAEKELIKTHEEGETEDWETAFRTVYEHPSDIIPKEGEASETISLHINTSQKRDDKTVHPMVILQQFQQIENNTYKWVNLQAHTVLPLKATGNMGMLPGRKKAFGDLPFYDNGIEAIKNDTTYSSRLGGLYKGSGVWNFTVTRGVSQSSTTVTLNVGNTTRYTGKYYIRTEALTNGWNNYKENLMTYSDYADYNSGFSHYFCKWLLVGNNVKFTIANDYAQSISDPLYGDATDLWGAPIDFQMVEIDQVLNEDANVRFAWYEMNNFVHRAYLSGSTHVKDRFLIVKDEEGQIFSHPQGTALLAGGDGSPRYGLKANEEIFRDDANWIYHADIQIFPGSTATVIAQHYGKEQTFIKERTLVYGDDLGSMTEKYPIRLLYDFKINRLITGYIPNGDNETNIEPFTTNLMLIRKHHEQATQLLFNKNEKTTQGAYGVMTFERDFLRDPNKSNKERAAYFISFPFNVKVSDIFGFGQFYKHWFIQYYDGAARAQNGLWADTDTYWKHITDPNTELKAYQGYALLFSLSNIEKSGVLDASKEISLYFPSTENNIGNITDANPEVTVDVPAHVCTIERENRKVKDSNWNLIGVPAYADVSGFANKKFKDPYNNEVYFYWKRDALTDEYTVEETSPSLTFQTMHAYMLQYAGVINWKTHEMSQPSQLIARRNTEQEASHTLRITLNQADKKLDQTYVRLQEEDATADFDMNKDQYKIKKAKANIYSLIQNAVGQIEAGANVLPLQTTIVPLGVIIKTAGEYTFSMPDGTDGIIAELIDYQTNTRTNLALDNYTVTLPAGTNHTRFAISLQPDKTITGLEDEHLSTDGSQVKKFLIDGVLYMQKDGMLYDAQGRCVR